MCGISMPKAADRSGRPAGRRGGRPAYFCSKECRELSAATAVMQNWLYIVSERATPEAWGKFRGQLWTWANASPNFQKAMAVKSKERAAATRAHKAAESALAPTSAGYVVRVGDHVVARTETEAEAAKKAARFSLQHPDDVVDVRRVSGQRLVSYRGGKKARLNPQEA